MVSGGALPNVPNQIAFLKPPSCTSEERGLSLSRHPVAYEMYFFRESLSAAPLLALMRLVSLEGDVFRDPGIDRNFLVVCVSRVHVKGID